MTGKPVIGHGSNTHHTNSTNSSVNAPANQSTTTAAAASTSESFFSFMTRRLSDFGVPDNLPFMGRGGSGENIGSDEENANGHPSVRNNSSADADLVAIYDDERGENSRPMTPNPSITYPSHGEEQREREMYHSTVNESPSLHRAGLLQPRSYNASSYMSLIPSAITGESPHPHTPDSIRAATLQLSNMPFPASFTSMTLGGGPASFRSIHSGQLRPHTQHQQPTPSDSEATGTPADKGPTDPNAGGFIFPETLLSPLAQASTTDLAIERGDHEIDETYVSHSMASSFLRDVPSSRTSAIGESSGLDSSISTLQSSDGKTSEATPPPSVTSSSSERKKPSGLSLLRPAGEAGPESSSRSSSLSSGESRRLPPPHLAVPQYRGSTAGPESRLVSEVVPNVFHPVRSPSYLDSTPTASPTSTPRPPFQRNLSAQYMGPTTMPAEVPDGNAAATQYHVRWRSPPSLVRALEPSPAPSRSQSRTRYAPSTRVSAHETTPLIAGGEVNYHTGVVGNGDHGKHTHTLGGRHVHAASLGGSSEGDDGSDDVERGWSSGNGSGSGYRGYGSGDGTGKRLGLRLRESVKGGVGFVKDRVKKEVKLAPAHATTAVKAVPAVMLGTLLNILDGISYGMIIFPATGVFAGLGPMGVSMFFVSAVVAQLTYTLGGSGFVGANGSMMIEVVPFFHILATSIAAQMGEDDPGAVIATTLVAYAFSSILTGVTFFFLGALKLGVIIGFFPRHILVGCIGGVGAFLIKTGLAISTRVPDDEITLSWETMQFMFLNGHNLILWVLPLGLAVLLRLITHKFHHQLIFPAYFLVIPIVFYVIVAAAHLNLGELRAAGWLFDIGDSAQEPWYKFYSYYNIGKIHFAPLWATLPTQFALLFFNILHPPLNVPALAVSLNTDVDTNKELVAHGYSNLLSGVIGSVPNYLVYVNTLLFYRVGGDNRISGFLLAVVTAILLVIGTGPIAFIPVMVVGALIFVLGIDLVKEALWDTRHRVTWSEYVTIASIMVCMSMWDFVIGVLFGIVVSCFFFVVQNSQLKSIRAMYTGNLVMSAVRRPSPQRAYIQEVAKQTMILRLQGFLFFGTITHVEETIRDLIEGPSWSYNPIQFLVLDLTLVAGVDMSSAEAFVRIQRLLTAKHVTLVFCGFSVNSPVGKALMSVDVLGTPGVELFSNFGDAMEWTENAYLRAWLKSHKVETTAPFVVPGRQDADIHYSQLVGSFVKSPRRSHLRDAGDRTIASEIYSSIEPEHNFEPLNALSKAFSSYGSIDPDFFRPLEDYLVRLSLPADTVVWQQDEPSDGLYIIESGVLRASYKFPNPAQHFEESMVAGTLAGELTALADSPRNATVVVEYPAVVWKMSNDDIRRLQNEHPELARVFIQLVLKAAKIDYDILLGAIASRH